jgi:23S rRNA (uracil1939-C5)-methyltransferase
MEVCPVYKKCGGCDYQGVPYKDQLKKKEKQVRKLLAPYCQVYPIVGMEHPYHYRNKVHAVFSHDRKGNAISGVYQKGTHWVVPIDSCQIEDEKADEIICSIRGLLKSFKIRTYDEDTGYGLLRHVLIRRGFASGQILVVLVTASPIFPSKNNFVKALRKIHPEITTIVQNVNGRGTSMVLGEQEKTLYGKGYIEDTLCGCTFRISPKSFYQVNPVQTEKLYEKAIRLAALTGKETVIDAYCGIGTIGLIAASQAKEVIGVELNRDAIRDAITNAKTNQIKNVRFTCADAGKFMVGMASAGERADVVFMDPPRSGSDEVFMDCLAKMAPKRVVYVSCNPETLARDLAYLEKKGYQAQGAWPYDMFGWTAHCETVCLISKAE